MVCQKCIVYRIFFKWTCIFVDRIRSDRTESAKLLIYDVGLTYRFSWLNVNVPQFVTPRGWEKISTTYRHSSLKDLWGTKLIRRVTEIRFQAA